MKSKERAKRKIDRAIDRYAADVGYREMELLLQERAQDMREKSEDDESITADDIFGWSA